LISQINANQWENLRSKSREVLKSRRDTGYRPCGNNFRGYRRIGKNQYEIEPDGTKFAQKAFEMYAGSEKGGRNLAVLYSFAASCKANGIVFRNYLEDILPRLANATPTEFDELLPHRWKPAE